MTRLLVVTAVPAEADAIRAGASPPPATPPAQPVTAQPVTAQPVTAQPVTAQPVTAQPVTAQPVTAQPVTAQPVTVGPPAGVVVVVEAVGVGPAAAAAGTARLLAVAEATGAPFDAVLSAGIAGGFPGRAGLGATVLAARSIAADLGAETPDGFLPVDQLGFGTSTLHADAALLKTLISALPQAIVGDVLTVSTVTGTAATAERLATRHPAAVAEAMEGYGVASAATAAGIPFAELRTISNPVGPRDRASWHLPAAFAALTSAGAALTAIHPATDRPSSHVSGQRSRVD